LTSFRDKVLAVRLFKALEIFLCRFSKREVGLAAGRQRQTPLAGFAANLFDKLFGLSSRDPIALATENAMDAMPVSHDVDAEHAVTIGQSLKRNAVFGDFASR
jgi:hypothetical protein